MAVTAAGTLSKLRVNVTTAPGASPRGWTIYVRKNGVNTTVTCSIGTGATSCTDITHTVTFAATDTLSLGITASATAPTNLGRIGWVANYAGS